MKFIIAFAILIAGISALPQPEDATANAERLVSDQIIAAINDVSQSIKDAGLDPLEIKREAFSYALPVPVIFNTVAVVEDLLFSGISDIVIHRMSYSVLTFRLNFDLELPQIHFSVGSAYSETTIFGKMLESELSGGVDINSIRIVGQVQVRVGIISGISVSSVTIDFTLGSIDSYLTIGFQDYNLSNVVNTFIGTTIPNTLDEYSSEINELIEIILLDVINANL